MSSDSQNLELGNYRVLNRDNGSLWVLGKGSYGTTYKAEHIGLERISALKVINDHLIRDDVAKQRFQQEAKAAASLDHAHIASIHDFGEVGGMFYYAMKYCSGGDLENFCTFRGPQPWQVVKSFALQILGALKAAHDKGMLHRDLKPSNVMLADENEPINLQLIDFGLVKALDHHDPSETALMATREGAFMGNPLTASPEQFREEELDERSDLFSLGITLWYLLHGGSPFGNVAAAKIAHQRLSVESYDDMLPAGIPGEAHAILSKLLATDREQRFRYAQEVIESLQATKIEPIEKAGSEPAPTINNTPLADAWEISSPVKQLPYGTYYDCHHKQNPSIPPGSVFIPDELSPHLATIHHHAGQLVQYKSPGLCNFSSEGEIDGARLYLCQGLSNFTLHILLQLVNRLSIHNDLALLKQIALAVDEAAANQLSGVEMEDDEIFLALDPSLGRATPTAEEWPAYIQNEAHGEGGHTAGIVAIVLPRLVDDTSSQEASTTIGGDDLASNSLARFAAFLYRVLSGMSAKQTAYLSTVNYVSFSDVSEESNQFLSHIIAGMDTPESALSMLQQVCSNEGSHFDGTSATIQKSIAATNPLATISAPPKSVLPRPREKQVSPQASRTKPIPPRQTSPSTTASVPRAQTPASATAVVPPPKAAPSTPKAKAKPRKKTKKKGNPFVQTLFALILLGALATSGYFGWQHLQKKKKNTGQEFVYEGPVEDGIGEIIFTQVSFGNESSSVPIGLQDSKGVTLGTYQKVGETIKITDFPTDIFKDASRWPLTFASLDPDFTINTSRLKMESFKGESLDSKTNNDSVRIRAKQTTILSASLSIGGKKIENGEKYLKFLTGESGPNQWRIIPEGDGARITLEEGQIFPIQARLSIPHLSSIPMTINREATLEVTLSIEKRPVKVWGVQSSHALKFSPEFTKIQDELVRELLQTEYKNFSISGDELLQQDSAWEFPSLSGIITVNTSNQTGYVQVSKSTSCLVLIGEKNHPTEETDDMVRTRIKAESGDVIEQVKLAELYVESGEGNPNHLTKEFGFRWFLSAAEQNDIYAITNVGIAYRDGGMGIDKNFEQAFYWLSRAAEENEPRALGALGLWYEREKNPKRDIEKAKEYYLKAHDLGDIDATGNLSGLCLDSDSAEEQEKGIELLEIAIEKKHPFSTYLMGYAYVSGRGVPRDKPKAIEYFKAAAALKEPNAIDALKVLQNK